MRKTSMFLAGAAATLLCGCVATQKVPVSTDPPGALVYLDGKTVCQGTPCSVDIPKDQDHLLTIVKDGYHQRDVPVRRVYDAMAVLKQSARDGVRAAEFGGGLSGGVSSAVRSADDQDKDGRAYVLKPDMITMRLIPADQPLPAEPEEKSEKRKTDPVNDLGLQLYKMLKGTQQDQ